MWCDAPYGRPNGSVGHADATPTTVDEVRPLDLQSAVRGTGVGKLWNEFVSRYDYLGSTTLVGAQMRYVVHPRDGRPVGMLGFSTAAWKLAPRDSVTGWTLQKGEKTPPFVVDNRSFLMLPWIVIPNLGPHILAIVRRRLPEDRTEHHNTTPVLIKTFVETPRHRSRLQSIRLDPCRGHLRMRMRALPPANGVRQAQERRLTLYSAYSAKRLEVNRE